MPHTVQFDPLPLLSVKPGLDGSLSQVSNDLERYFAAPEVNRDALQSAISGFQRACDVLRTLSLEGAAAFCGETEKLMQEVAADILPSSAACCETLQHALSALMHYLDTLADGTSIPAMRLFPEYQELQQVRGVEMSFEVDLFFPDLQAAMPPSVLAQPMEDATQAHIKAQRSNYQMALLRWLRQNSPDEALQSMRSAVQAVMKCVPPDRQRIFWWVASALLDCMIYRGLPVEQDARKLLGRIDLQMKSLAEGQPADTHGSLREMLYLVACSQMVSDTVAEVKRVYALESHMLQAGALPAGETDAVLNSMQVLLEVIEESWELRAREGSATPEFSEQLAQLVSLADQLDCNTLQYLCYQIRNSVSQAHSAEQTQRIALDTAMAFLLLGSGIKHYRQLDMEFHEQALILIQRMQACIMRVPGEGNPEAKSKFANLVALHCKMDKSNVMVLLANEIQDNLQQVEQGLNAFFGDTGKRGELAQLVHLLHQAQGGLHILSLDQSGQLLRILRQNVERYASGSNPAPTEMHAVAATLSTLGAYVQNLAHGQEPDTVSVDSALSDMQALQQAAITQITDTQTSGAAAPAVPTQALWEGGELLEVFLEEAQEVLDSMRANLESIQLHPESRGPLAIIRRGFHTLKGSGRMVGLTDLAEVAWVIERAMNKWLQGNRPATPGLLKLILDAETKLKGWIDSLRKHGSALVDADELANAARQIETGAEPMTQVVPAGETVSAVALPLASAAAPPEILPAIEPSKLEPEAARIVVSEPAEIMPAVAETPVAKTPAVKITPQQKPAKAAQRVQPVVEERVVKDDVDEQLLPIFLEETNDLFPQVGGNMRAWCDQPDNKALGHSLQRSLHTLKGSARMAGAMRLGELAHQMEGRVAQAMLQAQYGATFWEELGNYFDRIGNALEQLRNVKPIADMAAAPQEAALLARSAPETGAERATPASMVRVRSDTVDQLVNESGEISVMRSRVEAELRGFKTGLLELTDSVNRLREQLREIEIQAEGQIQARVSLADDTAEKFDPLEFDRFTRLQELTRFMNESVHDVLTVQQTLLKNLDEASAALSAQKHLNRELQKSLMAIRMVPFANISERLYRIVRQTSKELNKKANLELRGTDVELDRSMLEKMTAPFEHLLRNAIAHGLESPQQREQAGKPPMGEIRLALHQENNEVVFVFSDDGAGIDLMRLRQKAIELGLPPMDEKAGDEQVMQLIFTPGLTTATEVTEVSGRGVGMDVVRSEIAALSGRIDVSSVRGKGTRFIIHLPLTLEVTHVLMVHVGQAVYAIPSGMLEQVQQIKPALLEDIYHKGRAEWQGKLYPLHYLPHLLGDDERVPESHPYNALLLLRNGEQRLAVHVDDLIGNQEVVVKNLGPQLAHLHGITGATVMVDGSVVLILNPVLLAQRISSARKVTRVPAVEPAHSVPVVMVVDDSLTVRKITTRLLARAGYEVVTAKDGVDALEQLSGISPAVMLLDIEMPRMDGFELTKRLRGDPKTQHLPIIMITSRTAEKHRNYAQELGVNAYLGKPYQEEELLQQIAGFVTAHS